MDASRGGANNAPGRGGSFNIPAPVITLTTPREDGNDSGSSSEEIVVAGGGGGDDSDSIGDANGEADPATLCAPPAGPMARTRSLLLEAPRAKNRLRLQGGRRRRAQHGGRFARWRTEWAPTRLRIPLSEDALKAAAAAEEGDGDGDETPRMPTPRREYTFLKRVGSRLVA